MDLHSGGSSLLYLPATQVVLQADGTLDPRERDLVESFGAPHNHILRSGDNRSSGASRRKGALFMTAGFAGSGTVSREALRVCEHRLARALHTFGLLKSLPQGVGEATSPRYEIKAGEHYVYASEDVLYEPSGP